MNELAEGKDFYYNEGGYVVFSAKFHLQRGYCCGNGCRLCPYNYSVVPEPKRSELLLADKEDSGKKIPL